MARKLIYNGVEQPSFIRLGKINNQTHPPISLITTEIPGRAGSYLHGSKYGDRVIQVALILVADSLSDLEKKRTELNLWLIHDEPKKLVLPESSDKYYLAKVSDLIEIEKLLNTGRGTVNFICTDPFAYGEEQVIQIAPDIPVVIENKGDETAYPVVQLDLTEDTTEFGIVSGDEFMYFGQPTPVGTVITPKRSLVIDEDCSSISDWTTGGTVDGGTVQGNFKSDGSKILVEKYDTTESQVGWHGPAIVKTLDSNQTAKDFVAEITLTFKPNDIKNVQRLELYLLDINGASIGKIALVDGWSSSNRTKVEARAGALGAGYYFVNTEVGTNYYSSFYGYLKVERKGKYWRFWIGKIASDGHYWGRWSTWYYDKYELYTKELARIQIHMGAHGKYQPRSQSYIHRIRVWKHHEQPNDDDISYVFEKGDQLKIDCSNGDIFKNGLPFFNELNPSSDFLSLNKGTNVIAVQPPIIENGTIAFRERWL
ncbi:phage tail family protein [Hazenella sp. IB182357]|uniref:Phage tail family protein n=1 Tax=Polycladospora coralii TaxID=2771432 RepID=A0A926RYP6_9BACL|nr:distal tail protein Dit [Polycladospora coralii]MBD1373711.1 phage tail family protein [Polycladospora coralii]